MKFFHLSDELQDPPISSLKNTAQGFRIEGYFGSVYYELGRRLNFTAAYVESPDNVTGSPLNGEWNGLIGMLQRNEIDLAVGPMSFDISSMYVSGYLRPLLSTK